MNRILLRASALLVAALAAGCASTTLYDSSGTVAGSGTAAAACDLLSALTAAGAVDNAAAPMYGCGLMLPR